MKAFDDEHWLATLDACNAAALGLEPWDQALSLVAQACGSRGGQLVGIAAGGESFSWLADPEQTWVDEFVAMGGIDPAVNPRLETGLRAAPLHLITDADVISPEDRRRHPFYVDFLDKHDVPYICATNLIATNENFVGLAVLRSRAQGEISSAQREVFAALAPHVRSAARTQIALEDRGAQILAGALEALSLAVFICDGAGAVRAMTPSAEALVGAGEGLRLSQGQLRTGHADETARLASALRRASVGAGDPGTPANETLLIRQADALPLVVDVLSLPRRPFSFGFEPRALVLVRSAQTDAGRTRLLLQAAYGLTAAEAEVALSFAEGLSPEAVAAARGVSVGTVRAQLRAIYLKLGVHRQTELMARLRQLA